MTALNGHTNSNGTANGHLPDRGIVENFLTTLWPDGLPGRIAICHRKRSGEFAVAKLAASINEAVAAILGAAEESCTWMGVGAIRFDKSFGRGEFNDVVALPGLWVEIDYGKPGGPPDLQAAISVAMAMPIQPTLIVHSGHGIHCYWLLKEAWELSGSADRSLAQTYLYGLRSELIKALKRRGFGLPDAVSDLPRVLRPAGTENWKDPTNRIPVVVVHHDDAQRYVPDDFEQYVPEPPPDLEPANPKRATDDPNWEVRPGDAFNGEATWPGVANLIGWTAKLLHNGRFELLRCPDEKYGKPSSSFTGKTGYKGRDRITIFSGNCGLKSEPDEFGRRPSYSKFELFAAVKFPHAERPGEGEFKAATKSLIGLGFGKPRPQAKPTFDPREYGIDPGEQQPDPERKPVQVAGHPDDDDKRRREPVQRRTIGELVEEFPRLRDSVIHNIVRRGETGNIISVSKIGKSWLCYYFLFCFVLKLMIFDRFPTSGGRALLIDNELHPSTLASRLKTVAAAMGIVWDDVKDLIDVWTLRGNLRSIYELSVEFSDIPTSHYTLVIFDAKYRMIGEDASENDNGDETRFYNEVDRLAEQIGASILLVHHSTKGSQSDKRTTDVGAGAGAQSRAADAHIVLREHEEDDCFVLDGAVRSFPPIEPLGLRFKYPLWEVADDLDPTELKGKRSPADERQQKLDDEAQGQVIDAANGWKTRAELQKETGLGVGRLDRAIAQLRKDGFLESQEIDRTGKRGPQKVVQFRKSIKARGSPNTQDTQDANTDDSF